MSLNCTLSEIREGAVVVSRSLVPKKSKTRYLKTSEVEGGNELEVGKVTLTNPNTLTHVVVNNKKNY